MKLWTWQGRGFDIADPCLKIEHDKSPYYNDPDTPSVKGAYCGLSKRLGANQFIWCYTRESDHFRSPADCTAKWELDVPQDRILGFIDDLAWNRILGIGGVYPTGPLHKEARRRTREDPSQCGQVKAEMELEIDARYANKDLWSMLFVPPPVEDTWDKACSALVPFPVEAGWVKGRPG
jgi:hypothetical protein